MSIWTDWFLAEESEAEAIAGITSDETNFDDWPHFSMKLGDLELMELRAVLADGVEEIHGDDLAGRVDEDGGGHGVMLVLPAFINELASLKEAAALDAAARWIEREGMEDWKAEEAAALICELSEFARRARTEGKPVLSLATW